MQAAAAFCAAPSISRAPPRFSCVRAQRNSTTANLSTLPDASSSSSKAVPSINKWAQKTVVIPPQRRGCHLVTSRGVVETNRRGTVQLTSNSGIAVDIPSQAELTWKEVKLVTKKIVREIEQDLSGFKCGLAHLFLHHTSASLTINENCDSDVRHDTETFLNQVVPEGWSAPWKHTLEGPDDMPAHIKSSMFGCALMIPITNGHLNMGTWQGIWLCEHRDLGTPRQIIITLNGI